MFKICSWETFYTEGEGYGPGEIIQVNNKSRNNIKDLSNSYVCDCSFVDFNDKAIFFLQSMATNGPNLLIERCLFKNLFSPGDGGAISFSSYGNCVIAFVCGVNCGLTNSVNGLFSYVCVTSLPEAKNYVIDSSITMTKQTGSETLDHVNGDIQCVRTNVSHNEATTISGIYVMYPSKTSSISFCSFRNNTATISSCIYCEYFNHNMNYTNIIENIQHTANHGTITSLHEALLTIFHCSIFGNSPNKLGAVFFSQSDGSSIACNDCCVDNNQTKAGKVKFIDKPLSSFINNYQYLERDDCKATP